MNRTLRLVGWVAHLYLGYWLALLLDRVFVQLAVYLYVGAPQIDWSVTPFRVLLNAPGLVASLGRPSAAALLIVVPLLIQATLLLLVLCHPLSSPRGTFQGNLLVNSTALWVVVLQFIQVELFAAFGGGTWARLFRLVVAGTQFGDSVRISAAVVLAAALWIFGTVLARRLLSAVGATEPGARLWHRLLFGFLAALPAFAILAGTINFSFRGFGPRTLFLVAIPSLFVLACFIASQAGRRQVPKPPEPSRVAMAATATLAVLLFFGLANATALRNQFSEQKLSSLTSPHYEFLYDPAQFNSAQVRALAEKREQILTRMARQLGMVENPRIRVVLYGDFVSKRLATASDRTFTVSGSTIRAVLAGYVSDLDPAADAQALLNDAWGPPASPLLGAWVARWLAGEWHGRRLDESVVQMHDELGPYSVASLLEGGPAGTLSSLVRTPLGAAWVGHIYDQDGLAGVRKLYSVPGAEPNLARIATAIGTTPTQIEKSWAESVAELAARNPQLPVPHRALPEDLFLRGVGFSQEGWGSRRGGYDSPEAAAELRRLREMGVNAISVVPYAFMPDVDATTISYQGDATDETDEELSQALYVAHGLGMRVMLKPQIWVGRGHFTGQIHFEDPALRAAWMRSYRELILHYARLAELEHFDVLCIGVELEGMTVHADDWRSLIADIRRVYHGPLTYAANWGREFEGLRFWDALDYAGLNDYYPLASREPSDAVSPAAREQDIFHGAERVAGTIDTFHRKWKKPILFTEVGYPSVRGGASQPWIEDQGRTVDLDEQAHSYEAVFRASAGRPWLRGMFWWKWPSNGRGGGARDTSFTPFGKPAADVLRAWYTQMAQEENQAASSGP